MFSGVSGGSIEPDPLALPDLEGRAVELGEAQGELGRR